MLCQTNRALARPSATLAAIGLDRVNRTPAAGDVAWTAAISPVFHQALQASAPRTNWTRDEIAAIYNAPLMDLAYAADTVHRRFHNPGAIQMCTPMNITTGGCSKDCSYSARSSRHQIGLKATKLLPVDAVHTAARDARDSGSTRLCMNAAWRDMRGRKSGLRNIKTIVERVHALGLESCVSLGMLDDAEAKELKDAGLTAYNHNVDTSREHYPKVKTTRSYDERLQTISNVRDAGIKVCTGGILGLGESAEDHVGLLHTVATMPEHPESFPVNTLVPIEGTPPFKTTRIKFDAVLRTIATARMIMPKSIIRLAAGRVDMSEEKQVLCFMAGANAVFTGEKMLTTACSGWEEDLAMFGRWGLFLMRPRVRDGELDNSESIIILKGASVNFRAHMNWVADLHRRSLAGSSLKGVVETLNFGNFRCYVGEFDDATISKIRANPDVAIVEPDHVVHLCGAMEKCGRSPARRGS